jgi:hypothetical protein
MHINDLKSAMTKKYTDLNVKKDEILNMYRDGIAALKRIELHRNLCKDPNSKEHLIDIYYNESSMNQFKNACLAQLRDLKVDSKPIAVPKAVEFKSEGLRQTLETLKTNSRVEDNPEI